MPFHFYCPQGHLLEGLESQMGMPSQCPLCGANFLIPVVGPTYAAPAAPAPTFQPPVQGVPAGGTMSGTFMPPAYSNAPHMPSANQSGAAGTPQVEEPHVDVPTFQAPSAGPPAAAPPEPRVFHIPCPNAHELESPEDMLGQYVMCPECRAEFRLRLEDSLEYKREQAEARLKREARVNQLVLRWSIAAAMIVVVAIVAMITYLAIRDS